MMDSDKSISRRPYKRLHEKIQIRMHMFLKNKMGDMLYSSVNLSQLCIYIYAWGHFKSELIMNSKNSVLLIMKINN